MGVVSTLLTAAVLAGPPVEVSTFVGEDHKGELTALADGQLTLSIEGAEKKLPLSDVLEVRFATKLAGGDGNAPFAILTDGSRLTCNSVVSTQKTFTLESAGLGPLEIPAEFVGSIRLAPQSPAFAEAWTKLTERRENSDLLIIPKGKLLDFLKGVVGPITPEKVQFLLGGNSVDVNRTRVFGVVYGNRKTPSATATCKGLLTNRDAVEFQSLKWSGEAFEAELVSGAKVSLPVEKLISLDFSLGKVQFLSDITPRKKTVTVPLQIGEAESVALKVDREFHDVQINLTSGWNPLTLDGKVYPRGLCIHSKTELSYRLSKEMRRFQAVMGIDDFVAKRGLGDVKVTIRADGKPLFESVVKWSDKPRKLDLDVTDVVVLEILVDFVDPVHDLGVGDHLDLADAKFIK